jgi:hypothetical protein
MALFSSHRKAPTSAESLECDIMDLERFHGIRTTATCTFAYGARHAFFEQNA